VPGQLLEEPGTSGGPSAKTGCEHGPSGVRFDQNRSPLRWWAVLPGFPPTEGLPEILLVNGTDASAATIPSEKQRIIDDSPEPPLLLLLCFVFFRSGPHPAGSLTKLSHTLRQRSAERRCRATFQMVR